MTRLHALLRLARPALLVMTGLATFAPAFVLGQSEVKRNVILFVADGMRHGAIDPQVTPTFAQVRRDGVDFVNSHSVLPTITMVNAAAIATGHYPGDTGVFGNNLFAGYPGTVLDTWSPIQSIEDDRILQDLCDHFMGNLLSEDSFVAAARMAGFKTAVIGKLGPTLLQDITRNNLGMNPDTVETIVIDDRTGYVDAKTGIRTGVPLPKQITERIAKDPYLLQTYFKNQAPPGEPQTLARAANGRSGTKVANTEQQKYLIDLVTHAVLPSFVDPAPNRKPFVMVYWSRDPDGTQHNQGDSIGSIAPGVNGETVRKAFENVDSNLKQLIEYLKATPDVAAGAGKTLFDTTNILITSDHGFATVTRKVMDNAGTAIDTYSAKQRYRNVQPGELPPGNVAIELAHDLEMPLYDPDTILSREGEAPAGPILQYKQVRIQSGDGVYAEYPAGANGLLGGGIYDKDGFNASLLVSSNGGSDLIYLLPQRMRDGKAPDPARGTELIKKVVASLNSKPQLSGVFVDTDRFGEIPGALPISMINLRGAARTPVPAVVVGFRSFSTDPQRPEMTGVEFAETGSPTGLGIHGSFGRHTTYNCMMAIGPDFKKNLVDTDPVSNADLAQTISHLLGLDMPARARGNLQGRLMSEALASGPALRGSERKQTDSAPGPTGVVTRLMHQIYVDEAGHRYNYIDAAGFPGAGVGVPK